MKKVILSISAMLFVGFAAVAQNTSAVGQTGNGNNGIVGQNGSSNSSKITQVSPGGAAPASDGNKSEVYQGIQPALYAAVNNKAEVDQNGKKNTAFISQSNKNNQAYQTQKGNENDATIWQDQIVGPASALNGGDKAWQTQTGNKNKATIDQGTTGNEYPTPGGVFTNAQLTALGTVSIPFAPNGSNEATQTQNGDYNLAYASQGGTGNKSWQTQTSPSGTTDANKNISRHFQYGDGNESKTVQSGIRNTENTLQIGNMNTSDVKQTNAAGAGNQQVGFSFGNSNHITVTQTGL